MRRQKEGRGEPEEKLPSRSEAPRTSATNDPPHAPAAHALWGAFDPAGPRAPNPSLLWLPR